MRKKLFLINGRYSTVHYPDRISIVEIEDIKHLSRIHPLASIVLNRPMTDKEACLMALDWLRSNHYITSVEYSDHRDDCDTAAARGMLELLPADRLPEDACLLSRRGI